MQMKRHQLRQVIWAQESSVDQRLTFLLQRFSFLVELEDD